MYFFVAFLVVLVLALGVNLDAYKLCVERGSLEGSLFDMSPTQWGFVIFLNAIVAFPAYLYFRHTHKKLLAEKALLQGENSHSDKAHGSVIVEQQAATPAQEGRTMQDFDPEYQATADALDRYEALHVQGALNEQEYKELKSSLLIKFAFSPCTTVKA